MEIEHRDNRIRVLVKQYVLPAFGGLVALNEDKTDQLIERCRLQHALKFQTLEWPGPAGEGCLFFSISAMVHAYCYDDKRRRRRGTTIWNKCQFIFYGECLLGQEPRTDYIELLESSELLYITYTDLLDMMQRYKDIDNAVRLLAVKQNAYYRKRNLLLNLLPTARVEQFRAENQQFLNCSSQETQAMHVNMSLRSYIDHVNKLR